jgi:hypothetical protein
VGHSISAGRDDHTGSDLEQSSAASPSTFEQYRALEHADLGSHGPSLSDHK